MVKPAGQKKSRKYRRGRGKNKLRNNAAVNHAMNDNKCILYHLNIRGLNSKRKSLEIILRNISPQIITLNETALRFKQKPNLENFISFNRNRSNQIMGGVATFVQIKDKDNFVKLSEGFQNDEYLITRHSNFVLPVNIINIYGEQESRCSKSDVEDRWGRILTEIKKIEQRRELALIIGDLNKHIGNDNLGVFGNHGKVTFGGELVRGFLASGEYICLNNSSKAVGGPFTRFDPSNPDKAANMSCLSLVIVSKALEPFIEKLEIDCKKDYSPIRPLSKTKSITSDHFPLILTFVENFCTKTAKKKSDCFTMWNTNKEGGWNSYKELTEEDNKFDKACEVIENDDNYVATTTTSAVEKIDNIMNKIKYTAFGKVKRKVENKLFGNKSENVTVEINQKLLEKQRKEIEAELKNVEEIKHSKGS